MLLNLLLITMAVNAGIIQSCLPCLDSDVSPTNSSASSHERDLLVLRQQEDPSQRIPRCMHSRSSDQHPRFFPEVTTFDLLGAGANLSADPRSDDPLASLREAEPELKPAQILAEIRNNTPTMEELEFAAAQQPAHELDDLAHPDNMWIPTWRRNRLLKTDKTTYLSGAKTNGTKWRPSARQIKADQSKAHYQTVMQELTQQAEAKRQAKAEAEAAQAKADYQKVMAELNRMGAWAKRSSAVRAAPAIPEEKPATKAAPQPTTRAAWKDTCAYPAYTPAADAPVDPEAWTEVKKGRGIKPAAAERAAYYNPKRIEVTNQWSEFGKQIWADDCAAHAEAALAGGKCDMPTFVEQPSARAIKKQSKVMHKVDNAEAARRAQVKANVEAAIKLRNKREAQEAERAAKDAKAQERFQANKNAFAMKQMMETSGRAEFASAEPAIARRCGQTAQYDGQFMDMSHYQRPMPLA